MMTKIKMSIEWDNSITEISDVDKTNSEYCKINITNTFKKFAIAIGGEHLWNEIARKIDMEYESNKDSRNEFAELCEHTIITNQEKRRRTDNAYDCID